MKKVAERFISLRTSSGDTGVEKFEVQKNVPDYILNHVQSSFGSNKSPNAINHKIVEFYKGVLCSVKMNGFWRYIHKQAKIEFENEDRTRIINHLLDRLLSAYLKTPPVLSNFDSYSRITTETEDGFISTSYKFRKRMNWTEVEGHRKSIIHHAESLRTKIYAAPSAVSQNFERDMDIMAILPVLEKLTKILKQTPPSRKVVSLRNVAIDTGSTTIKVFSEEALAIFNHLLGSPHYGLCKNVANQLYPEGPKITEDMLKYIWREVLSRKSDAKPPIKAKSNRGGKSKS